MAPRPANSTSRIQTRRAYLRAHTAHAHAHYAQRGQKLAWPGSPDLPASCDPAPRVRKPPTAPFGLGGRNPHGLTRKRPVKIF